MSYGDGSDYRPPRESMVWDYLNMRPVRAPMVLSTYSYSCPSCHVSHSVDTLAPQGSPHIPTALTCGACHSPCLLTHASHRPADVTAT